MTLPPAERLGAIRTRLTQALAPIELEIRDDSHLHVGHAGAQGGGHYAVVVRSAAFSAMTRVQRHQLVYRALSDMMPGAIHALSIRAIAPEDV